MSNKEILILSIFTFITVLLWTFFEAYHTYTESTVPKSLQEQIQPITPTLKKDVINSLRVRLNQDTLPTPSATTSSSILPEPTISSSPSAF